MNTKKILSETTICEEVKGRDLKRYDCIVDFRLNEIFHIIEKDTELLAVSPHISGGKITYRIFLDKSYWKAIQSNSGYFSGGKYIKQF